MTDSVRPQGGMNMFSSSDLQYFNRYVAEDYTDVPEDRSTAFRNYMEKNALSMQKEEKLKVVKDSLQTLPEKSQKFANTKVVSDNKLQQAVDQIQPVAAKKVWKKRIRKCNIETKDRDIYTYPSVADFRIFLGRAFTNVTEIKLIDMVFPNVDAAITNLNNMIYWRNFEDAELESPSTFTTYVSSVKVGNYRNKTLEVELTSQLNSVNIKRRGGTGQAHYFIVTLNSETDLVSFVSIIATAADTNPIYTLAGTGIIRVKQTGHGYSNEIGKTTMIQVIGVRGTIGGIAAAELNGMFPITVLDENYFSYEVATPATTSAAGAGGSLVKTGRTAPFQFLFGEYPNTIATNLGFPKENSSDTIDFQDPLQSMIKFLSPPDLNNLNSSVEIGYPTVIWCHDHDLEVGDKIYLYNFMVQPSIYEDDVHKGIFTVLQIFSSDRFAIDWTTTHVSDVSKAYIGTQTVFLRFPSHGFNDIYEIAEYPVGSGTVHVTTKWANTFKTGDGVLLKNTNSVPSIDGYHKNITVIDDDTFSFQFYADPQRPDTSDLSHLTSAGNAGILTSDHSFYLYNVQSFGGFTTSDLNNTKFEIRRIIDGDNLVFVTNTGFSTKAERGGGGSIRINSKIHGWRGTQTNALSGDLPYKPIDLAGNTHAYLCTPEIYNDNVVSTGQIKNIFAKLYLPLPPGFYIYNQFDATPIIFDEKPIARLDEVRFVTVSPNNLLLDFAGLNYNFSLEITELVEVDENNNKSSNVIV